MISWLRRVLFRRKRRGQLYLTAEELEERQDIVTAAMREAVAKMRVETLKPR